FGALSYLTGVKRDAYIRTINKGLNTSLEEPAMAKSKFVSVLALVIVVAFPQWMHAQSANAAVTFTKDVSPILQSKCQSCHRADSMAPMSLVTYEEARPWAK